MNRSVVAGLLGVAVVTVLIAAALWTTRKNRVELNTEVLKVRTLAVDAASSIAVLDFRVHNPSAVRFVVRDVLVDMTGADGNTVEGQTVSEMDAERVFAYYKVLGQKYNPSLVQRDRINPGQTMDRMIAISFPVPEAQVLARKNLVLRIRDLDGKVSEVIGR